MDGMWIGPVLAQAVEQAPKAAAVPWQLPVLAAAVIILPFVFGQLLAQALRLKDLSVKMGVVLLSISLSLAPFLYQLMLGQPMAKAIAVGIDLAGGTNLIYEVDQNKTEADGKTVDKSKLLKVVGAISRRINPSGAEDLTIRPVGTNRIEIIIPGADREKVEQTKRRIVVLGSLEFAILANSKDHRSFIELGQALRPDQDNLVDGGRILASWRNVAPGQTVESGGDDRTVQREVERTNSDGQSVKVRQFLVVHEGSEDIVTGEYLIGVRETMDQSGQPAVAFNFNAKGGVRFGRLTGRYMPDKQEGFKRRLAVLLNGEIQSAPNLLDRISTSGQISGNFDRKELDDLINVLNAGALEVPLIEKPISEFTISPLLGVDVQTKGIRAIIISAVAVVAFMLLYYRTAGVVANLCLALNLLMVIGSMAFIEATFTLPGLAGLVLTIGMAVDSNVLIHERMREELARGASLRMAIENGFDKALSAIVDGNVTSLITAVILYMVGSDQIRGFAVSLFIGLSLSMFSVLYFGHMCFQILERKRVVKTLTMAQWMGVTNIDFLRKWYVAVALSLATIIAGFAALGVRGKTNFDIDFTGGTLVTFEFVEPQRTDAVKDRLVETFEKLKVSSTVSLERLVLTGELMAADSGKRFRMRTTENDQTKVTKGMAEAFNDPQMALVRVSMKADAVQDIPAEKLDKGQTATDRFAGGHQASIQFSSNQSTANASTGLATATVATYAAEKLRAIPGPKAGSSKYDAATSLIDVTGTTAAPKDAASTSSTEKFVAMTIRTVPQVAQEDLDTALQAMIADFAANPAFEEINSFDTSVAGETQRDALLAILASLVMVVVYIWYRFEKVYFGYAAVVALAHDVLITLGGVCLAAYLSGTPIGHILMFDDFKINLALVASLLTIVGYSLNDTIVIFDRLREIKGKNPKITYDMINRSVNETLSRTLLTATTTFIVVVVMYLFGGDGIHGFAFSMIIGVITGCYSTIYIANPMLLWLVTREQGRSAAPPAVSVKLPAAVP